MNITKKQWTIIGVVIALIAIWYFFLRKKPTESNYGRQKVKDGNALTLGSGSTEGPISMASTPCPGCVCNGKCGGCPCDSSPAAFGSGPRVKVAKGNTMQDASVRG